MSPFALAIVHDAMAARRILSFRHILVASPELVERFGLPTSLTRSNAFHARYGRRSLMSRPDGKWAAMSSNLSRCCPLTTTFICVALRSVVILAAAPIRERRLVPLLPQYPLPEWPINLLYPSHRHQSTIVRAYLNFCQSYLPNIVQACEI